MAVNGKARIINSKVLSSLLELAINTTKNVAEVAGVLGQKVAHHAEHSNLDLIAWAMIKRLDSKDPDRRARALAHFDSMREGLEKADGRWANNPTHYGDLAEMSEQEADEAAQEEAAAKKAADLEANQAKVNEARLKNGITELTDEQKQAALTGKPVKVGAASTKKPKATTGMPGAGGTVAH